MKKNLGKVPAVYPMPVLIVAAYDENGKVCAMNAAWGMICAMDKIALFISEGHKTTQNILATKAFTVSIADKEHMDVADFFGIATGNKMADKFERTGYRAVKSELVNAPTVTWSSTDANIADYYPGYGLFSYQEGEATVTASAGGSSVEIPIVSSLSPVLLGDADRDNEVAIYDTTIIQRKIVNMDVKRFSSVTADVDGDGETTVYDATFVQRWLANINTRYPIGEEM